MLQLAVALVVSEKEELVLDKGPADRGAELVALQRGLEVRLAKLKAARIQNSVAQELVSGPMKLIAAGFHDRVHHRSAHPAIFGAVVAGDDFKLRDRIRRR